MPPDAVPGSEDIPQQWERRAQPPMLNRRYEFAAYKQTRRFLDALAALAEAEGIHPRSISFGTTYVNVTLDLQDGGGTSADERALARRIEDLYTAAPD